MSMLHRGPERALLAPEVAEVVRVNETVEYELLHGLHGMIRKVSYQRYRSQVDQNARRGLLAGRGLLRLDRHDPARPPRGPRAAAGQRSRANFGAEDAGGLVSRRCCYVDRTLFGIESEAAK